MTSSKDCMPEAPSLSDVLNPLGRPTRQVDDFGRGLDALMGNDMVTEDAVTVLLNAVTVNIRQLLERFEGTVPNFYVRGGQLLASLQQMRSEGRIAEAVGEISRQLKLGRELDKRSRLINWNLHVPNLFEQMLSEPGRIHYGITLYDVQAIFTPWYFFAQNRWPSSLEQLAVEMTHSYKGGKYGLKSDPSTEAVALLLDPTVGVLEKLRTAEEKLEPFNQKYPDLYQGVRWMTTVVALK